MDTRKLRRHIRYLLSFFVVGLVISGLAAFLGISPGRYRLTSGCSGPAAADAQKVEGR